MLLASASIAAESKRYGDWTVGTRFGDAYAVSAALGDRTVLVAIGCGALKVMVLVDWPNSAPAQHFYVRTDRGPALFLGAIPKRIAEMGKPLPSRITGEWARTIIGKAATGRRDFGLRFGNVDHTFSVLGFRDAAGNLLKSCYPFLD